MERTVGHAKMTGSDEKICCLFKEKVSGTFLLLSVISGD